MDNRESRIVIGTRGPTAKVTRGDSAVNAARRTGNVVAVDKKKSAGGNKAHLGTEHQRIAKLDRENEVAPLPKMSSEVGMVIQRKRMEQKLSQKDVALKIHEKGSVLREYETGKAVPTQAILSKIERVLKVKLRGADIGKSLE